MVTPFDIFKTEPDGARWIKAVQDIDTAIKDVESLGASSPGRYIILSQVTANKFYLDVTSHGVATAFLSRYHE